MKTSSLVIMFGIIIFFSGSIETLATVTNTIAPSLKVCSFDDLQSELYVALTCVEDPYSICDVKCPEGDDLVGPHVIICLPSGKWSPVPQCHYNGTSVVQKPLNFTCSLDTLPNYIHIEVGCLRTQSHICRVSCGHGENLKGAPVIKCLPSGEWSEVPTCEPDLEKEQALSSQRQTFCKENQLPRSLRIISSCYPHAKPGTNCSIICYSGMMMQGTDVIKCLSSGGWSSYPYCLRHSQKDSNYCTEEELPPDLMLEETCSRETDSSCSVKCPESKIIVGPSEITCLSTGRWSDIPFCDDKCDEEARFFSGKCYKLMWKTQGTMAHWKCQTLNMEPLLINNQQVFNFIVDFLKDLDEECLWTSVNDIGNEQVWRDGTGELVTFFNWYPGEPDVGYYGERRDCVAMPKWRNYQYSDYPCIQSLCRFICQYDAKS